MPSIVIINILVFFHLVNKNKINASTVVDKLMFNFLLITVKLKLKISKTCKTNLKGSVDYDMLSSASRTVVQPLGFAYSADVDLSGLYSYLIT